MSTKEKGVEQFKPLGLCKLDGIATNMRLTEYSIDGAFVADRVECPCGFVRRINDPRANVESAHALRFHYTHCPKARGED